jgi:predicted phage tail protein
MTNVYLYGELRNKFGEEFKFNINSAKEAFLAINSNKRGFLNEVKKLAMQGIHYRIVIDENVVQNPKEMEIRKAPKEIHIVPIVWGAGKNGALIAVGLALTIATAGAAGFLGAGMSSVLGGIGSTTVMGAAGAGSFSALGTALFSIGVGIALQGVMGLLFPPPKPDFNQEVQAGGKSYLFGNKPSNTSQGQAVPVGYGRLKIGSSQISAGVDHYALNTDIKQLMTPVDKPINDYIELIAENEAESGGSVADTFSTNQAVDLEDTVTFCSVNVLNSYIDITTNSADKVISTPVEVVVKRNGEIISNPDLTTFDEDVTYEWEELSNDSSKGKVKIENPYAVKSGLAIRAYHVPDYTLQSNFSDLKSYETGYFQKYAVGDLVKFGLTQFNNLKFAVWDSGYDYYSGEVVNYPTGSETNTYFQAIVTGSNSITGYDTGNNGNPLYGWITGVRGYAPTGAGATINSTYWRKILPPNLEYLYKCVAAVSGHLPTTGALAGGAPVAESTYWSRVESPTTTAEMNTLFSDYPAYEDKNQYTYIGPIDVIYEGKINGANANVDNYGMEFLGYFYVPTVGGDGKSFIKDVFEVGTGTGLYEIIKIGDTGQWSGLGFTGLGGTAITPRVGSTFYKKQVQGTGNGKIMPVGAYEFKLDSDDASDLHIDSTLASAYYSGHGMFSGFANLPWIQQPSSSEIAALHSSTTTLYLTAGYHRLLGRVQDLRGAEGISIYYRYDTNKDGVFSDWHLVPKEKLFHSVSDLTTPKTQKFSDIGKKTITASEMIAGEEYKIVTPSTTNWTSIGAPSSDSQIVFVKNSTAATNNGTVAEDFITYSEQVSAESNRLVRFESERPTINGAKSAGYSAYKARYRCKVNINNKQTVYSSPVKVNIQFLSTSTSFKGIGEPILSQKVQTA